MVPENMRYSPLAGKYVPDEKSSVTNHKGLVKRLITLIVLGVVAFIVGEEYLRYSKENQQKKEEKVFLNGYHNDITRGSQELAAIAGKWGDAQTLALATPRVALYAPIVELQRLRANTKSLDVGMCLNGARNNMVKAMDETILNMTNFMGDAKANVSFGMSAFYFESAVNSIKECKDNKDVSMPIAKFKAELDNIH